MVTQKFYKRRSVYVPGWRSDSELEKEDEFPPEVSCVYDIPAWFWECSDRQGLKKRLGASISEDSARDLWSLSRLMNFSSHEATVLAPVHEQVKIQPAKKAKKRSTEKVRKLVEIAPKDLAEQRMSSALALATGGLREVITPAGRIDVMTEDYVIEVKAARNWKHGLGQALVYGFYYPEKKPALFLFGDDLDFYRDIAKFHCEKLDVFYCEPSAELKAKAA